jgi:hypothetical protein
MPYYGRITEAGIGGPKEGAHQKAWPAGQRHPSTGSPSDRTYTRPQLAPEQQSQIGTVPGMKGTIPEPEEGEAEPGNGLNGNGTMDGGADLDLVDAFTVGAELAADAEEAEACAWTVTEAEAHMIQMEMDAEARKKRRFWELLLAVGGGFMLGKMWKG